MDPIHHRGRTAARLAALVATSLLTAGASGAAEAPILLSPGTVEGIAGVESPCPTFSWTLDPDAAGFELEVYRLGPGAGGEAPEEAPPVLAERLPAGSTGWTPPFDRCLEPGRRYAWFLRAEGPHGPTDWSEGYLFEIAVGAAAAPEDRAAVRGAATHGSGAPARASHGNAPARGGASGAGREPGGSPSGKTSTQALPPAAFNVNGSTRITGDYGFALPRRVRRLFPAAAFQLQKRLHEDDAWILSAQDSGSFLDGTGTLNVDLVLGLDDLPHLAEITAFTCRFLDNTVTSTSDPGVSAIFHLRRRGRSATEPETIATLSIDTVGSSSLLREESETFITLSQVSEVFSYWIDGTFQADSAVGSLAFYGCELEYEVEHVGPLSPPPQ